MGEILITYEKLENPQSGRIEYLSNYTTIQTLISFWINALSASTDSE